MPQPPRKKQQPSSQRGTDSRRSTKFGELARKQDSIYKEGRKEMASASSAFMRSYAVDSSADPEPTIKALNKAALAGEKAAKFRSDSVEAAKSEKLISNRAMKNPAPADNTRTRKRK